MTTDTVLPVTGASPYDVVVGTDLSARLPQILGDGVQRVGVVFPESLGDLVRPLLDTLAGSHEVTTLPVPDGEPAQPSRPAAGRRSAPPASPARTRS